LRVAPLRLALKQSLLSERQEKLNKKLRPMHILTYGIIFAKARRCPMLVGGCAKIGKNAAVQI